MRRAYMLAIISALLISCQETKSGVEFEPEAVRAEAHDMLEAYHDAIRKGGLLAEFAYLDSSSDFFWVPPGYTSTLGYDSVRTILEGNAASFRSVDFHWKTLRIFPLSPSIANFSGIVTGTMVDTAGTSSPVNIIESGTLIRREDGWKLLSGQSAAL